MFEDNVLERDKPALADVESPPSVPASRIPDIESDTPDLTARAPHESPAARQPVSPVQPAEARPEDPGKARRGGLLHRRPFIVAIGALLLAATLGGGYVYVDNAEHFVSTDDAFVAARQSALAPKVSGYITAVPVTDNEHVAAGQVIARVDDRDYRTALEQARSP